MKTIIISIQPKWVEKIASGEKTIEVRKTAPKEAPFKALIYCTKNQPILQYFYNFKTYKTISEDTYYGRGQSINYGLEGNGKVVDEFICDKVDFILNCGSRFKIKNVEDIAYTNKIAAGSCLDFDDMEKYFKGKTQGFALHISDLKIYDKPKELPEFKNLKGEPLKRPFQSWGYVEEIC